jgi:hypothetical protein
MNTRKRCNGAPWRMTNPSLDDLLVEHAALDCRRIMSLSMAVSSIYFAARSEGRVGKLPWGRKYRVL